MKRILTGALFLLLLVTIILLSVWNYYLNALYQQGFEDALLNWERGAQQLFALQEALDDCMDGYDKASVAEAIMRANLCDWEWTQLSQYCINGPGQAYRNSEKEVEYHGRTVVAMGNGYGESDLRFLLERIRMRLDDDRYAVVREPEGEMAYDDFVSQAKQEIDLICETIHSAGEPDADTPDRLYRQYIVTMAEIKEIVAQSSILQTEEASIRNE